MRAHQVEQFVPVPVTDSASETTIDPVGRMLCRCRRRSVSGSGRRSVPRPGAIPAATADRIRLMLDACPDTHDRHPRPGVLALGFAGAFRRSELAALQVSDLAEVPDGYRVIIRRSKTDQEGQGAEIAIPRGGPWRRCSGGSPVVVICSRPQGGHLRLTLSA